MRTLLYGGTFDPPHNGHMNNLRAALALVQPDRALVMPAGTPPHKHASATPAELRLQMCACFTALSPAVQVSDWEIRRGGRSYTVHTLEWLRGQDPDGALYLCVGSDMLLTFQEWYRWQDMLKMAALVVESRTGTDEAALHAAAQLLANGLDGRLDGIAHLLDIRNHARLHSLRRFRDDAADDRTSLGVAFGDGHHDVRRSQVDCDDVILLLHVCQLCFIGRLPCGRSFGRRSGADALFCAHHLFFVFDVDRAVLSPSAAVASTIALLKAKMGSGSSNR